MMPALRLGRGKRIPGSALVVGGAVRPTPASARLTRRMLPTRNLRRHARMVIPHVVLSLFAADVVRQLPGARVPPTASIAQSFGQAPCSATKNFIEDTVNRVFAAIGQVHVNGPAIERKVGGFLGKILRFGAEAAGFVVNAVINAAHQILLNGIKVAIGLVTNAVAGVAAVIHTLGSIGNAILPWSPKLVADPPALAKSVDKRNPGTFDLKVTALGSDLEWPDWIKDCARTFGIELPTLKPKDADVKWDLGN